MVDLTPKFNYRWRALTCAIHMAEVYKCYPSLPFEISLITNLEIIFTNMSPTNMTVMVLILDGNSGYNAQA